MIQLSSSFPVAECTFCCNPAGLFTMDCSSSVPCDVESCTMYSVLRPYLVDASIYSRGLSRPITLSRAWSAIHQTSSCWSRIREEKYEDLAPFLRQTPISYWCRWLATLTTLVPRHPKFLCPGSYLPTFIYNILNVSPWTCNQTT